MDETSLRGKSDSNSVGECSEWLVLDIWISGEISQFEVSHTQECANIAATVNSSHTAAYRNFSVVQKIWAFFLSWIQNKGRGMRVSFSE